MARCVKCSRYIGVILVYYLKIGHGRFLYIFSNSSCTYFLQLDVGQFTGLWMNDGVCAFTALGIGASYDNSPAG